MFRTFFRKNGVLAILGVFRGILSSNTPLGRPGVVGPKKFFVPQVRLVTPHGFPVDVGGISKLHLALFRKNGFLAILGVF